MNNNFYVFHRNGQGSARSQWYGGREFANRQSAEVYADNLRSQAGNGWYAEVAVCDETQLDFYMN